MKHSEADVEKNVQVLLARVRDMLDAKPNEHPNDWGKLWANLEAAERLFRPKPPRVGTLVIKTPDPVFPNATTVINDGGIEFTDEVRQACADAGIEWEETT